MFRSLGALSPHTTEQPLTATPQAVCKTEQAKRSRLVCIWARIILGLLAVSIRPSWGPWQTAANRTVIATLLLISRKEGVLNRLLCQVQDPDGNRGTSGFRQEKAPCPDL